MEGLKYLAASHRSQFDERRRIEWRVIFAALSFYVGTTSAVLAKGIKVPVNKLSICGYLLVAVLTASYLAFIHMANNMNKSIAENAEDAIAVLLGHTKKAPQDLFDFSKHWTSWCTLFSGARASRWGWFWEAATLLLFAMASVVLIKYGGA
jgi:hypothetical protein